MTLPPADGGLKAIPAAVPEPPKLFPGPTTALLPTRCWVVGRGGLWTPAAGGVGVTPAIPVPLIRWPPYIFTGPLVTRC
jgi:hypothetical protein